MSCRSAPAPAGRQISVRSPLPFDRGHRVLVSGRRLLPLLNPLRPDTLEVNDRLLLVHTSEWARDRGLPVLLSGMSTWMRRCGTGSRPGHRAGSVA